MTEASLVRHHEALHTRHEAIERNIHIEQTRPHPDDIEIKRMKISKLHIKDILEHNIAEH